MTVPAQLFSLFARASFSVARNFRMVMLTVSVLRIIGGPPLPDQLQVEIFPIQDEIGQDAVIPVLFSCQVLKNE